MQGRLRKRKLTYEQKQAFIFLLPSILGFILFVLIPLFLIVYLSFTDYNVITPSKWNDYKNWIILMRDPRFILTLKNSFHFVILLIPMHMIFSLALSFSVDYMNGKILKTSLRAIYYFPTLIATSSIAMVWVFFFNKDYGLINYFLGLLGVESFSWLRSSTLVYPAIMLFSLWKFVGIYFLYFYIGLKGIDESYLDAAKIDGASYWQQILHIKLPLLTPTIFFVLITQMIGTIQIFDEPYMLTNGGPGDASRSINLYIYNIAFVSHKYGYASAMSIVLLFIVLLITLVQFRGSKWVTYDR